MTPGLQMSGRLPSRAAEVAPALSVVALASILLASRGVPVGDVAKYGVYFLTVIVLPGRLLWRWLWEATSKAGRSAGFHTKLEDWVFGAATGYTLELISYPLARMAGHPRVYVIVPLAVLLVLGGRSMRKPPDVRQPVSARVNWSIAGIVGYLAVWLSSIVFARTPLRNYWPSDQDETFHLSLVGELRHHFPADYPYIDAGRLTYQWFVHAHMAASTWATGLEPLVVYRRFDVLLLSAIAVLGTVVLTMRVAGRAWPGVVAAGLIVLVGTFDITGTAHGEAAPEDRFLEGGLLLNSPTQALAFAMAPPAILVCLELLTGRRPNRRLISAMLAGLVVLSGTKATVVPVIMAGFLSVAAVESWRTRRLPRRALIGLLCSTTVLFVSTLVLYGGDSHSLSFQPGKTSQFFMERLGMEADGRAASVVVAISILTMWLVSAAGLAGLLRSAAHRWDSRVWWLLGAAASGLGATFLLGHEGMSQLYFGRTIGPILAVLSAWGVSVMFPTGTSRRTAVWAALSAIAAGLLLAGVRAITESWQVSTGDGTPGVMQPVLRGWMNLPAVLLLVVLFVIIRLVVRDCSGGERVLESRYLVVFLLGLGLARSMAFLVGHYPDADITKANDPIPPGGIATAEWLKAHSPPDDRVITNAHCLPLTGADERCDSRHFWMSAFSERRFVLEGWAYTRFEENWYAPFWGQPSFLDANDDLFNGAAPSRVSEFASQHRAQWLLIDLTQPDAQRPHRPDLDLVFSAGDFLLFRIG